MRSLAWDGGRTSTSSRCAASSRWSHTRRRFRRSSPGFVLVFPPLPPLIRSPRFPPQNKEHEAKEELKRRAKQLEVQRREMTRRGQNPYANPAAPTNYSSAPSSYNPPQGGPSSYSNTPSYDSSPAPAAKPFKTKGMQLGAAKGRKNQDDLAAALGGLEVDDSDLPLLSQQQQHQHQQYDEPPQQQYQPTPPPAPATPSKEVNPFGEVEQGECVLVFFPLSPYKDADFPSAAFTSSFGKRSHSPSTATAESSLSPSRATSTWSSTPRSTLRSSCVSRHPTRARTPRGVTFSLLRTRMSIRRRGRRGERLG